MQTKPSENGQGVKNDGWKAGILTSLGDLKVGRSKKGDAARTNLNPVGNNDLHPTKDRGHRDLDVFQTLFGVSLTHIKVTGAKDGEDR